MYETALALHQLVWQSATAERSAGALILAQSVRDTTEVVAALLAAYTELAARTGDCLSPALLDQAGQALRALAGIASELDSTLYHRLPALAVPAAAAVVTGEVRP